MKPRISVLTLAVDDLEKSMAFYRRLGFVTPGIVGQEFEHGAVVFIDLEGGPKLALWERKSLLHDSGLPDEGRAAGEFSLGHNVGSRAGVDRVMAEATEAGAAILKPAHDTFWGGYAGYFQDPDGHLWEVVFNPALPVAD